MTFQLVEAKGTRAVAGIEGVQFRFGSVEPGSGGCIVGEGLVLSLAGGISVARNDAPLLRSGVGEIAVFPDRFIGYVAQGDLAGTRFDEPRDGKAVVFAVDHAALEGLGVTQRKRLLGGVAGRTIALLWSDADDGVLTLRFEPLYDLVGQRPTKVKDATPAAHTLLSTVGSSRGETLSFEPIPNGLMVELVG